MTDLQTRMRQRIEDRLLERMQDDRVHLGHIEQAAPQLNAPVRRDLERGLVAVMARILKIPAEKIDVQENVSRYGVNSIIVTEIMQEVSVLMGVKIVPTVFFEASNIRELAELLDKRYVTQKPKSSHSHGNNHAQGNNHSNNHSHNHSHNRKPIPRAESARTANAQTAKLPREPVGDDEIDSWIRKSRGFSERFSGTSDTSTADNPSRTGLDASPASYEPIAVIAMQGAFPGSPDLDSFWRNLVEARDCIGEVPADRWDWRSVSGDADEGPYTDVRWGGFVEGIDRFDASFFGIAPNEAELMDPQHRLFMEASWALLESAGIRPSSLQGRPVGVFVGVNLSDYGELIARNTDDIDPLLLNGTMHMFCPGRVSFMLRSTGPSQAIDTACSSSLVAVHRAAASLQQRQSELALAGGVNLLMGPGKHIFYTKARMLSADGRSRAFAEDAAGYGRSDGLGVVLLKRLEDAMRDGDEVLAVIRGSSENHQGTAASLTALNPKAMSAVIADAMGHSQVDPRRLGYVECHGPSTTLGDSIEVNALRQAIEDRYAAHDLGHPQQAHCGIGTVKSNIGHAETAAGIAGMLKVILALRHRYLPSSLYCEQPNPMLELAGTAFYLTRQGAPWPQPIIDNNAVPRMAGVSSFGAGGTNAHIVLEEFPPSEQAAVSPCLRCHASAPLLLPLSAHSPDRLQAVAERLLDFLKTERAAGQVPDLLRMSYTLQTGREALQYRAVFFAGDIAELEQQLTVFVAPGRPSSALPGAYPVQGERSAQAAASVVDGGAWLLQSSRLRELAQAWVLGAAIDWTLFYEPPLPRSMSLPTYPFARERHWIGSWQPAPAEDVDRAWETRALADNLDWLRCLRQALKERIVLLYTDAKRRAAFMALLHPLIKAAGLEQAPLVDGRMIDQADSAFCLSARTILILGPGMESGQAEQQAFERALTGFICAQQQTPSRDALRVYCLYEDDSEQRGQRAERLAALMASFSQTNTKAALRLIEQLDRGAALNGQERLLKEWLADEAEPEANLGFVEIRYIESRRQWRGKTASNSFERFLQTLEARARAGEAIQDEQVLEAVSPEQVHSLDAQTTDRLYSLMMNKVMNKVMNDDVVHSSTEPTKAQPLLLETVRQALSEILKLSCVDDHQSFQNYGLNSLSAMRFATRLEKRLGRQVRAEWFIEHCSVRKLSDFLGAQPADNLATPESAQR